MKDKTTIKKAAEQANSRLGKLVYRAVSVVPIVLLIVAVNSLIDSVTSGYFLSTAILLIPIGLMGLLIRYLWSNKRTLGDVIEANS